jgi:predicted DNA-binding transcriptional regulator AlpA
MIEPFLTIKDMMEIFGYSRVSVYRKVADARAGIGGFPIPLNGFRQKLLWDRSEIERYCQTQPLPVAPPPVNVDSPLKETKLMQDRRAHTETILAGLKEE